MGRRAAISLLLAAATIAGCGSSTPATVGPVTRAADITARVPGYRIAATMRMSTPVGPMTSTMNGVFDRVRRTGRITAVQAIAGRHIRFTELFSRLTFYLPVADIPALAKVTAGRPWVKFDMSRMLGAMGLGSLPTSTDPSQFVDYLRAVGSSTKSLGTAMVRGVSTAHYHAEIDLSRYVKLVPAADRATARRGIANLEAALGGHTLQMDAWIDRTRLVRRVSFSFPECVQGQHLRVGMTMDLYDYGPQKPTAMPPDSRALDITPLITSSLSQIKFGCSS